MQDFDVLLVSDRRERADRLVGAIALVQPCRLIEPGGRWPTGRPGAVVIDLARPLASEGWLDDLGARIRKDRTLCLFLTRHGEGAESEAVRRFGTPTLIPVEARAGSLVSRLLEAIEPEREARAAQTRRAARAETATRLVTDLFDAAAGERPPSADEADEGTELVLAAVSEAGIREWLDLVWRHHAGVYQHSLSVAGYAAAFGTELGLGRRDHHRLAQAALLHDVGKARIPAAILDKPGPLDPEETRVMRAHPAIGADLLTKAGGFEPAILDVVRHHHERLDGSGYPDGLKDKTIADLVRLVSICDVHSALTERRTYRPPLPAGRARAMMEAMAGQLDPDLLRAYRRVVDRAEAVA